MRFYRALGDIQALSFDLDDTLYDNVPVIIRAEKLLTDWLEARNPAFSAFSCNEMKAFKVQAIAEDPARRFHVTESRRHQLRLAGLAAGLSGEASADLADEAVAYFLAERSRVDVPRETFETLEALRKVFPLVAITNGNVDIDAIGLAPYFDFAFKAGFDGAAKPAADMFEKTEAALGLPGSAIVHVGDHLVSDVLGARKAGFRACWYNHKNNRQLKGQRVAVLPDVEIGEISALLGLL
ncbi:HAD-IA family hydrolase [Parasalinivibrio latis]|uniref:HAD-IA family hydrolase n=1 Tax=Parasalinivibrio latis TaxID=2952610 RepID=UPI0030E592C0